MFKMQTLNCLSLKISTYNIHACISSQKKRCDVTKFHWIPFASSRPMEFWHTWKSSHSHFHCHTCTSSSNAHFHFGIFVFPFPWDSHGNSIKMGIPFPCTSLIRTATGITIGSYIAGVMDDRGIAVALLGIAVGAARHDRVIVVSPLRPSWYLFTPCTDTTFVKCFCANAAIFFFRTSAVLILLLGSRRLVVETNYQTQSLTVYSFPRIISWHTIFISIQNTRSK